MLFRSLIRVDDTSIIVSNRERDLEQREKIVSIFSIYSTPIFMSSVSQEVKSLLSKSFHPLAKPILWKMVYNVFTYTMSV